MQSEWIAVIAIIEEQHTDDAGTDKAPNILQPNAEHTGVDGQHQRHHHYSGDDAPQHHDLHRRESRAGNATHEQAGAAPQAGGKSHQQAAQCGGRFVSCHSHYLVFG